MHARLWSRPDHGHSASPRMLIGTIRSPLRSPGFSPRRPPSLRLSLSPNPRTSPPYGTCRFWLLCLPVQSLLPASPAPSSRPAPVPCGLSRARESGASPSPHSPSPFPATPGLRCHTGPSLPILSFRALSTHTHRLPVISSVHPRVLHGPQAFCLVLGAFSHSFIHSSLYLMHMCTIYCTTSIISQSPPDLGRFPHLRQRRLVRRHSSTFISSIRAIHNAPIAGHTPYQSPPPATPPFIICNPHRIALD
ncbi:hypothetical protein PYCCODRAFT_1133826 [Trametes coccinea BRFM310]|uniref:Uncharacterized protein n=1 Tax=Trametes coccinea (strain BRFM310) TaxID=1353009 RepID=A0A1Y2I8T1_TRAC3|nr:hypothetical protein PYCCODRAFT_1133826 [Trametes coccinea BRFM310]